MHHFTISPVLFLSISSSLVSGLVVNPSAPLTPLKPSLSLPTNAQPICVSGTQWPQWRGNIDYEDCRTAFRHLVERVPIMTPLVFFSATWGPGPPPIPLPYSRKLPDHENAGDCNVIVRMLVDFSTTVLPIGGSQTYDPRRNQPFCPSTWREIIAKGLGVVSGCVRDHSTGGWIQVSEQIAVLVVPESSIMRINWETDDNGLGGVNGTVTIGRNGTDEN